MDIIKTINIKARQEMKWGHLFSMPQFYADILADISAQSVNKRKITFGQGLNFSLTELNKHGANVPVIVREARFVADSTDGMIKTVGGNRKNKIPALIMPRGI